MSRPVSKLSNFIMQIYNKIAPNDESRSPKGSQNGSPRIQMQSPLSNKNQTDLLVHQQDIKVERLTLTPKNHATVSG